MRQSCKSSWAFNRTEVALHICLSLLEDHAGFVDVEAFGGNVVSPTSFEKVSLDGRVVEGCSSDLVLLSEQE